MTSTHSDHNAGSAMAAEIAEQPALFAKLTAPSAAGWAEAAAVAALVQDRGADRLQVVARGTSGHAAIALKYLAESVLGLPVVIVAPSVVTQLGGSPWSRNDVVLGISQSGASPDIVACIASARSAGASTVAYVNTPQSPLADAAEHSIDLRAGHEKAVAATKSYTATLLALMQLVAALAPRALTWPWASLAPEAERLLAPSSEMNELAYRIVSARCVVTLGRGYGYATAREAALKIMETCEVPALAYSTAEFMHGPIAAAGPGTLVLTTGAVDPEIVKRCRHRGSEVVALPIGAGVGTLGPLTDIIPFQFLAREAAVLSGKDPDNPTALKKATLTL